MALTPTRQGAYWHELRSHGLCGRARVGRGVKCGMKPGKLIAGAVIALAITALGAGAAGAAIVISTYTGTVASGTDLSGANLTGDTFTAVYTTDTTTPALQESDATHTAIYGGAAFGVPSPASATITFSNGSSASFSGLWDAEAAQGLNDPFLGYQIYNLSEDTSGSSYLDSQIYSTTHAFTTSANYASPFSYTVDPAFDSFTGDGSILNIGDIEGGGWDSILAIDSVSVTVDGVGAVPEPATWAMVLVGFFGLGAVLRDARGKRAASAA
jgi:hypothetical protein